MNDSTVSLGLDYHQESVQVCVLDGEGRVVANRGVGQLYYVMICEPQDPGDKNLTGKEKTEARLDRAAVVPC